MHKGVNTTMDEGQIMIAHSLRAEGFDASEDGTGRGTPLVPVGVDGFNGSLTGHVAATMGTRGSSETASGPQVMVPVTFQPRIARNGRGDMGDLVNALQAQSGGTGKGDAAPCVAVAFQTSQSGVRAGDVHATLDSNNGSRRHNGVVQAMQVRRLTPRECERLQGFPDDWTLIPWRGRPASECPDGPRYKSLGNSMAVPCMRWIGQRIAAVDVDPFA